MTLARYGSNVKSPMPGDEEVMQTFASVEPVRSGAHGGANESAAAGPTA